MFCEELAEYIVCPCVRNFLLDIVTFLICSSHLVYNVCKEIVFQVRISPFLLILSLVKYSCRFSTNLNYHLWHLIYGLIRRILCLIKHHAMKTYGRMEV
jgi:hypothetical protein